jgi:Zn-dependent protease
MAARCYDRGRLRSYGPYDNSPFARFLRAVTSSFAIGTFFGVHVRMYWAAAVVTPLLFLQWIAKVSSGAAEALLLTALSSVALFVVIWTHEMFHIAAGWRFHIRSDLITLSPLGGLAHMSGPLRSPREELWVTLAGPAVHLVWLAVFWPLQWLLPARVLDVGGFVWCPIEFLVWFLVTTNIGMLLFNLLPIFPLDGGRTLRALLSMKWHPNLATLWATTVGMIGGGVLVVLGLSRPGFQSTIGVVIGISCITSSLQERRMAQHVLVYRSDGVRSPWEADPDAWKRGAQPERMQKLSWFQRWRVQRAVRKAKTAAIAEAALDREVDAVLERVHQVGMGGLSDRERAVLKRAAKRRNDVG